MSHSCPFCVLVSELPQNGEMLQTNIVTLREKDQPVTVNIQSWARLVCEAKYPVPYELSETADEGISKILNGHFPPTKREERYKVNCPHAPNSRYIKYVYYLVGDKTSHLLGKNEFLMRMWLEKLPPPSVDGSNATGTQ